LRDHAAGDADVARRVAEICDDVAVVLELRGRTVVAPLRSLGRFG
jgi:hypothetical protein